MSKYLKLLLLCWLLGCGVFIPNPVEEDDDASQQLQASGYFSSGENLGDAAMSRHSRQSAVRVFSSQGTLLTTVPLDARGFYQLTLQVTSQQLPLTLSTATLVQEYQSTIAQAGVVTRHINEVTTSITKQFGKQLGQTAEMFDSITERVMLQYFGVRASGEANLPLQLFLEGDMGNPDSIGNMILKAAVNSNTDLTQLSEDIIPVFSQTAFLEAFTEIIQANDQSELALEEITPEAGTTPLVEGLTDLANAETPESTTAAQQAVIEELQSTQTILEDRIQEVDQEIDQQEQEAASNGLSAEMVVALLGGEEIQESRTLEGTYDLFFQDERGVHYFPVLFQQGTVTGAWPSMEDPQLMVNGIYSEEGQLELQAYSLEDSSLVLTAQANIYGDHSLVGESYWDSHTGIVRGYRQVPPVLPVMRHDGKYRLNWISQNRTEEETFLSLERNLIQVSAPETQPTLGALSGRMLYDGSWVVHHPSSTGAWFVAIGSSLEGEAFLGNYYESREGEVLAIQQGLWVFQPIATQTLDDLGLEIRFPQSAGELSMMAFAEDNSGILVFEDTEEEASIQDIVMKSPNGQVSIFHFQQNAPAILTMGEHTWELQGYRLSRGLQARNQPLHQQRVAQIESQLSQLKIAADWVQAISCQLLNFSEFQQPQVASVLTFGCDSLLVQELNERTIPHLESFTTPSNPPEGSNSTGALLETIEGRGDTLVPSETEDSSGAAADALATSTSTSSIPSTTFVSTSSSTTMTAAVSTSSSSTTTQPISTTTSSTTSTTALLTTTTSTTSSTTTTTTSTTSSTTTSTTSSTTSTTTSTTSSTTTTTLPGYSIRFSPAQTITSLNVTAVGLAVSNGWTGNSFSLTLADTSGNSVLAAGVLTEASTTFSVDTSSLSNDQITASFYQSAETQASTTVTTTIVRNHPGTFAISLPSSISIAESNNVYLSVTHAVAGANYSFWAADTASSVFTQTGTLTAGTTQISMDLGSLFQGSITAMSTITYFDVSQSTWHQTQFTDIPEGLIGYYQFDDSSSLAADSSSKDNHGTVSGAAYSASGKANGAAQFDGSDDYIEIGSIADFGFGTGDFTIGYWVQFTTTHSSGTAWPQSGMYKNATGWNVVGNFEVALNFDKSLSVVANVQGDFITTGTAITTGTWYHVLVTRDNGTLKLYVDGQLIGSRSFTTSLSATNQYLGTSWVAEQAARYLHGLMDEFRIYNRVLSNAEICYLAEKSLNLNGECY